MLNQKFYITIKTLLITKQIELIRKKKFAAAAFDLNDETFVVYVSSHINTDVYLSCRTQIALLIQDNALITILFKYANFTNIFSLNLVAELI